jgi:hypothetical protein
MGVLDFRPGFPDGCPGFPFGRARFALIWFLERNRHHLKASGKLKINDNALAAIALLVAQSNPVQKELMIHLIMNLIRGQDEHRRPTRTQICNPGFKPVDFDRFTSQADLNIICC